MIEGKFQGRKKRHDVVREMTEAVDAAWALGAESVGVNAEDGSRTDIDFLVKFAMAAKEHKANRLRYCDTLGYDNPLLFMIPVGNWRRAPECLLKSIVMATWACSGQLYSRAKGAIDGGQDAYINTTINGIGERAGNADLVA